MIKRIIVNLEFESTHCWPSCPFEEVSFLRDLHRHIFYICCKKEVKHNDRDIEIIMFKKEILNYLKSKYPKTLGSKSCEDLAEELINAFNLDYCSVLEDNENGAEFFV